MTYSETIRHYGNPFTIWTNPEINRVEVFAHTGDAATFVILPTWGPMTRGTRFMHLTRGGFIHYGDKTAIRPARRD